MTTDREWDRRLRIATTGREDESGSRNSPYEPTAYAVLERLAAGGWLGEENHLLDYGCGKGRAVLYLAWRTGCRATGLDLSRKLIDMAEANLSRFASAVRADFVCCAAEAYLPEDEDAFFFFNPFSEKVLRVVLRRILTSWYARPRPMKLFFYYPTPEYLAALYAEPELTYAGGIDCRDLFDGDEERERIVIFTLGGGV